MPQKIENTDIGLANMPEEFRTYGLCYQAVSQHGRNLRYVPHDLRDIDMCERAVSDCGASLRDTPAHLRNAKLSLLAVRNDGTALEYVPGSRRTPDLCWIAIQNDGNALEHVPEHLRTLALCIEASHGRLNGQDWHLNVVPTAILDDIPAEHLDAVLDAFDERVRASFWGGSLARSANQPSTLDTLGLSGDPSDPSSDVGKALAEQQAGEQKKTQASKPSVTKFEP